MNTRQITIIAIALGILALGIFGLRMFASMKETPARKPTVKTYKLVRVRTIENDSLMQRAPIHGKLIAQERVEIFPEVTGRLLSCTKPFKVGQSFAKGEVLLAIDGQESMLALRSQRSQFISLMSQVLPDIKIDYPDSYDKWSTYYDSLDAEDGLPSLPQLEDGKLKRFLSARNVLSQYYSIKSLEHRQSKFTITSPFNGTIAMGDTHPGTVIRAGQKVGEIIRDDVYELEAALPLSDAAGINLGDHVHLTHPTTDQRIEGKVTRMASHVSAADQRLSIFIGLNAGGLREGMYLEGHIDVASVSNALSIDRNLINADNEVFLVQDTILVKRKIQVEDLYDESALVTGLNNGDVLLDQVVEGAYEGMLVKTESK